MNDQRYILMLEDGRWVTIGRLPPLRSEIPELADKLRQLGIGGWIARMRGHPFTGPMPLLDPILPLNSPLAAFDQATAAVAATIAVARATLPQ